MYFFIMFKSFNLLRGKYLVSINILREPQMNSLFFITLLFIADMHYLIYINPSNKFVCKLIGEINIGKDDIVIKLSKVNLIILKTLKTFYIM